MNSTLHSHAASESDSMIGVDVGGTFTDVVAIDGGRIVTRKVPTNRAETHLSVVEGATLVGLNGARTFNHASTHGLNAILTRSTPKVAFLTTAGHRDILDIGRGRRPAEGVMNLHWRRSFGDASAPLVPRYLRRGIHERITARGDVYIELDEEQARQEIRILAECEVQGVAICLLNSYINSAHEQRLAQLVREEFGEDVAVSLSSEVSPLAKEYARASTTVIDVIMKILFAPYTRKVDLGLREAGFSGDLNFADCAATLVPVEHAMVKPSRVIFSGPAAGTVASAHFGGFIGVTDLVCADVGGTSCDISIVRDGKPSVATTLELEYDLVVNTLSNEITAIGAGGGSIVWVSPTGDIQVGPESAGSDPGPACYDKGGTAPTTTDACLLIGILDSERFAGGRLNVERARQAFEDLDSPADFAHRVRHAYSMGINNLAEGVFNVLVKSGVDPRDYSLMAYGAAGPMLLPAIMNMIHVKQVIVPPHAGLFSALGLLSADRVFADSRSAYTVLTADAAESIDGMYRAMEEALLAQLGADAADVRLERTFDGQLLGQAWDTPFVRAPNGTIDETALGEMITNFHDEYERRSGNRFEAVPVQGVTYRINAIVRTNKVDYPELPPREADKPLVPTGRLELRYLADEPVEALEYERDDLRAGDVLFGPAVIREPLGTTHIDDRQKASVGPLGEIIITAA